MIPSIDPQSQQNAREREGEVYYRKSSADVDVDFHSPLHRAVFGTVQIR